MITNNDIKIKKNNPKNLLLNSLSSRKNTVLTNNDGSLANRNKLSTSTSNIMIQEENEIKREKTPFSLKNKAPNFYNYTGRKDVEPPITNNVDFYIPEIYRNKSTIDFSKMLERGSGVASKLKSPGICYYEPNYQILETHTNIPIFKVKPDKNDPKFKIQKIWRSYNTPTDYKSVAFN